MPVPSNPFSRTDSANGSGVAGDGSKVTQSLTSVLQVRTNGKTAGPAPMKLTPAEVQAKKNALQALRDTLPAALYPCVSLAAGIPLLASTPLGIAVGGTLIAVAGKLCNDYLQTIRAEINTVKDPPRSDFNRLALGRAARRHRLTFPSVPPAGRGRRHPLIRRCDRHHAGSRDRRPPRPQCRRRRPPGPASESTQGHLPTATERRGRRRAGSGRADSAHGLGAAAQRRADASSAVDPPHTLVSAGADRSQRRLCSPSAARRAAQRAFHARPLSLSLRRPQASSLPPPVVGRHPGAGDRRVG